jgi:pentose-5-phosphate-3-epimerase
MSEPTTQPFEGVHFVVTNQNKNVAKVNTQNKNITIDIENKDFIKELIKLAGDFITQKNLSLEKTDTLADSLELAREIAETLSQNGITVTLSYMGQAVATVGQQAEPSILQLITKTRAIALNSVKTALDLIF